MKKTTSLAAVLLLAANLIIANNVSAQTTIQGQNQIFQNEREVLRDRSGLDEETRAALIKRLQSVYQPPFHIGIEFGAGMTGSNIPEDHAGVPRAGMVINAVSTYSFHQNFALHFSINWFNIRGQFQNSVGNATSFTLDYLTFGVAPQASFKDGFFYFGPILGFKLGANQTIDSGNPEVFGAKSTNFGMQIGGGWKIDFLYQIRMHVSLEFNYFFLKWLDAASAKWRPWSVYLRVGILFGIGKLKDTSLD